MNAAQERRRRTQAGAWRLTRLAAAIIWRAMTFAKMTRIAPCWHGESLCPIVINNNNNNNKWRPFEEASQASTCNTSGDHR